MSRIDELAPINERDRRWGLWMAAAQSGDRAAYETLLRECIPFIKTVARKQGVQPDSIDDVVQETLLTVHQARQTYDPSRSFPAWLRTIAQRRAIDGLRNLGRKGAREVHDPDAYENYTDPSGNPEQHANRVDESGELGRAVATLPSGQREAVEQLALSERSLDEAARATGRTTGALKVNLHRALRNLRARMGARN